MYTLKVKVSKKSWRKSLHKYTYEQALKRQEELKAKGIESKIISC